MLTGPNVLSNKILRLHANITICEARGGTYGVWGEKKAWCRVGYLRLDVNERGIGVRVRRWSSGGTGESNQRNDAKQKCFIYVSFFPLEGWFRLRTCSPLVE